MKRLFEWGQSHVWVLEQTADAFSLMHLKREWKQSFRMLQVHQGSLDEVASVAQEKWLQFRGIRMCSAQIPAKVHRLEGLFSGTEQERSLEEDRLTPQTLSEEHASRFSFSLNEAEMFWVSDEKWIAQTLEDLPESLRTVQEMTYSPVLLAQLLQQQGRPETMNAHLRFFQNQTSVHLYIGHELHSVLTLSVGQACLRQNPEKFQMQLRHLFYLYWQGQLGFAPIQTLTFHQSNVKENLENLELQDVQIEQVVLNPALPEDQQDLSMLWLCGEEWLQKQTSRIQLGAQHSSIIDFRELWLGYASWASRLFAVCFVCVLMICLGLWTQILISQWNHGDLLQQRQSEMVKLDSLRSIEDQINQQQDKMQDLLKRRSQISPILQTIAKALPKQTWLGSWEMSSQENISVHQLKGFTFSEVNVSGFLQRLEETKLFSSVRLNSTEMIAADQVELRTGIRGNHRSLIQFEMTVMQ